MSLLPNSEPDTHISEGAVEQTHKEASGVAITTSVQRAAVIIALLGESAAKPIVEKLDDQTLGKVAVALETISFLAREELIDIVMDFLTHLRHSAGAMRGSRTMAHEVVSGILEPSRLEAILGDDSAVQEQPNDAADVWSRLERKEPEQVATYLSGLSANLAALILRQLDVAIASDILCHMSDDALGPVMGYMIETRDVAPGIDSVIERLVEMEFLNVEQDTAEQNETHLESIGELLSLIPREKRDSMVELLQSEHPDQLENIQKSIFTIDSLPDLLIRKDVPVVFRELEMPNLIKLLSSLKHSYTPIATYLLENISSRMADQIRDELNDLGELSGAETEDTQREFLSDLMGLKRRGLISLEKQVASQD